MKTITYNPETHVLVPREPNPNWCAGCSPDNCSGCWNEHVVGIDPVHSDMLDAATQPESNHNWCAGCSPDNCSGCGAGLVESEPVAEVLALFPGEHNSYMNVLAIGVDPYNTWSFPQPGTKLYTLPPTAEQIANETAEAIAKFVAFQRNNIPATGIEFAEVIRNGAWKEFKQS